MGSQIEIPICLVPLIESLSKGSANTDEEMAGLREKLQSLRVHDIRTIAKQLRIRLTGTSRKLEVVDRIIAMAQINAVHKPSDEFADATFSSPVGAPGLLTPEIQAMLKTLTRFDDVTEGWSKCFADNVEEFHFIHLLTYLVYSRDKSFDMQSMKAFRSLKGYRFFADNYVHNVWTRRWPEQNGISVTYVRGYVHHSLTCDTPLVVFVALNSSTGEVYLAQCNCVAG